MSYFIISAPGPQCPARCDGTCTVILGNRTVLPCDDCALREQVVNTTWMKIVPENIFITSSEPLQFGITRKTYAGRYRRSQYLYVQRVGRHCVTGEYSLNVTHHFCEFFHSFLLTRVIFYVQ